MYTVVDEYDSKHGKYQDQAPGISTGAKPFNSPPMFKGLHNPHMTNGGGNGGPGMNKNNDGHGY